MKRKKVVKILNVSKYILFYFLIFLSFAIIFGTNWAADNAEITNFEQVLFTLNSSVSTASSELISSFIIDTILTSIIITVFVHLIGKLFKNLKIIVKVKVRKKVFKINFYTISNSIIVVILIIYAILYLLNNLQILEYIRNNRIDSNFFEEVYVNPKNVELEFPKKKRNLIYIFLESMESTYSNKDNGGAYDINYIPELTEIANNNINFSNNNLIGGAHMTYAASWTTAGIIAHTAGIPVKTAFRQDDVSTYNDTVSLEGAYSLGEILNKEGYRQYIMVGSDLTFGGRRVYLKNHGNYTVFDYNTAKRDNIIDDDYYVFWGYEDKKLFSYAKKELKKIAKSDEPFNFTMLTVDTHFPDGYLDESCDIEYDDHYLSSVACSSKQLGEFVEWIKKQDFYEDTTIILAGDHLSMNTYSFEDIDSNYRRSVYNVYINSAIDTECNKNREFTTFDYYPTTLAALGVKINGEKLGLGTNLFSCKQTLTEEYGYPYVNGKLMVNSPYYNKCIAKECKKDK